MSDETVIFICRQLHTFFLQIFGMQIFKLKKYFDLDFGPEPSVFSSAVENFKNNYIQDYNFACDSVWV
jgi:hypothetical protein